MTTGNLQKLDEWIRPAVEGQGYELVELSFRRERGEWIFQVTIDKKPGEGYISHGDCAKVSKEVSVLLDLHEELMPSDYHLEVSSPGPKRPLKTQADFARFIGKNAKVRLKEYAGIPSKETNIPRRNFSGTIHGAEADKVILQLKEGQSLVEFQVKDIEKAHLSGDDV